MTHTQMAQTEASRAYLKALGQPNSLTAHERMLADQFAQQHRLGDYHPDFPG